MKFIETLQIFGVIIATVLFFIFLSWIVGVIKKSNESKEFFEEGTPKDMYKSFDFDDENKE